MDHYASLGVSRTSEDVVIRAAYLALMRRYHPDANPSPDAAGRVRAITTAYEVLGNETSRRHYDRSLGLATPAYAPSGAGRGLRAGPLAFALTILSLGVLVWVISARSAPAPGGARISLTATPEERPALAEPPTCLSPAARTLTRAAVLRQANGLREGNRRIVSLSPEAIMVRTAPALGMAGQGGGAIECAAAITVLLPRGLVAADGAPTVQGEADFLLESGARGEAVLVDLALDDRFLLALASVRRLAPTDETRAPKRFELPVVVPVSAAPTPATSRSAARQWPAGTRRAATNDPRPCAGMACDDGNVRELEEQLGLFERQSLANADSRRRHVLRESAAQFEARRAACGTSACVRGAVLDRTVEVAEIMRTRSVP